MTVGTVNTQIEELGHLCSSLGQFLWKVLALVVYFWGQVHVWICDLLQLSRFCWKGHEKPETGGREDGEKSGWQLLTWAVLQWGLS